MINFAIKVEKCFKAINPFMLKKIGLIGLGLIFTTQVKADWLAITSENAPTQIYVNYSTYQKSENLVKLWYLFDYKKSKDNFLSQKMLWEFDCDARTSRLLAFVNFSGNMGSGESTYSDFSPNNSHRPNVPGSIIEWQWKTGCLKLN